MGAGNCMKDQAPSATSRARRGLLEPWCLTARDHYKTCFTPRGVTGLTTVMALGRQSLLSSDPPRGPHGTHRDGSWLSERCVAGAARGARAAAAAVVALGYGTG